MILKSKICGISDSTTLRYIINHAYPSQFIGFIVNYPKSKRCVEINKLKSLIDIDKKTIGIAQLDKENPIKTENLSAQLNQHYSNHYLK